MEHELTPEEGWDLFHKASNLQIDCIIEPINGIGGLYLGNIFPAYDENTL